MKFFCSLVAMTLLYASTGQAQSSGFADKETTCKQDSRVRKVKIDFKDEANGQDCQVSYLKETEEPGAEKVLWTAHQTPDFCQQKANDFVQKLQGMGWSCQ